MIDPQVRSRRRFILTAVAVAGVAIAAAVLYGRTTFATKRENAACANSAKVSRSIVTLQQGDVAAMNSPASVAPMPALSFTGPDGKPRTLADFRGKTVLLNLWATWCVPCREEMPALDKLQAQAGSKKFEVVTVNIDTTRLERPKAFLSEIGVKNLAFYADPKADVFYQLKQAGRIVGLPTSFLVGPDGCEIGTLAGAANWASEDALNLVKAAAGS